MMSELMKRGTKFDGPAITMLRERDELVVPGRRPAAGSSMYSGVCRVRVVKRLQ